MILFINYLILGLSFFYKIINLVVVVQVGESITFFNILHAILKNSCEGAIVTMLISVAWGWTIIHMNFQIKYQLIAVAVTLVNVVCAGLWHYS